MDYAQLYAFYKRRGLSDDEADRLARQRATSGLPDGGERPGGLFAGLRRGVGETVASYKGIGGLVSEDIARDVRDYMEDRPELTAAGQAGRVVGRLGSELAGLFAGGGLALKAASKIPAVARGLQSASRLQRGAASAVANLPIDALQAAAYGEGAILPGYTGALAENVLTSGAAGALLGPARRTADVVEDVAGQAPQLALPPGAYEMPPPRQPITDPERMIPSKTSRPRKVRRPKGATPGMFMFERRIEGPEDLREPIITPPPRDPITDPERLLPEESGGAEGLRRELMRRLRATYFEGGPPIQGPMPKPPIITPPPRDPIADPERLLAAKGGGAEGLRRELRRRQMATYFEGGPPIQGPMPKPPIITPPPRQPITDPERLLRDSYPIITPPPKRTPLLEGEQYTLFSGIPLPGLNQLKTEAAQVAIGAGLGGAVGSSVSEDDPLSGGLAGALVGAGLGAGAYRAFSRAATNPGAPANEVHRAAQDFVRNPERAAKASKTGPVPTVERGMPQEVLDEYVEQFPDRPTYSIGDLQEGARRLDVGEVYRRFASGKRILPEEQLAIQNEVKRLTDDWLGINEAIETAQRSGLNTLSSELQEAQALLAERMMPLLQMAKGASDIGSSAGLSLRLMQEMYQALGIKSASALRRMTMNAMGVKRLRPDLKQELDSLLGIVDEQERLRKLAEFATRNAKNSRVEIALDSRRAGLLSRAASWVRNIAGATEQPIAAFVETPVARAMDSLIAKATGGERVFGDSSIMDYASGFSKGAKEVWENRKAYLQGMDFDNPTDVLGRRILQYENAFGPDSPQMVKSLMRGLQRANDAVYGLLAAGDRPFYQGALNQSLKERALMRALSDDSVRSGAVKAGSPEFDDLVRRFLDPATANNEDLVMATFDALDATYKAPTAVGELIRTAKRSGGVIGAVTDVLIPFPNTPTNIVRKALERMPIIGLAAGGTYRSSLKRHVARMKREGFTNISEQAVERQLKRMWRNLYAKQVTTTPGLFLMGYALHKNGMLTLPYTPSVGASEQERNAARMRGLTGEGSLALRIGDSTYDLGSTLGTIAPLLALGAAWSAADDQMTGDPVIDSSINRFGAATGAIGQTVLSMPLLTGFKDIVETLQGRGMAAPAALGRQAGSLVPFSAALGGIARATDQEVGGRRAETFFEGATANIPGLSRRIAPRVTALGEVPEGPGAISSLLQPFTERKTVTGPIYDAFREIGWTPTAPRKLDGESEVEYAARRQAEGELEREVLGSVYESLVSQGILKGPGLEMSDEDKQIARMVLSRALSRVRAITSARRAAEATTAR